MSWFSKFYEVEKATVIEMKADIVIALIQWHRLSNRKGRESAEILKISGTEFSAINRGKVDQFSLEKLVKMSVRAGLTPTLKVVEMPALVEASKKDEGDAK